MSADQAEGKNCTLTLCITNSKITLDTFHHVLSDELVNWVTSEHPTCHHNWEFSDLIQFQRKFIVTDHYMRKHAATRNNSPDINTQKKRATTVTEDGDKSVFWCITVFDRSAQSLTRSGNRSMSVQLSSTIIYWQGEMLYLIPTLAGLMEEPSRWSLVTTREGFREEHQMIHYEVKMACVPNWVSCFSALLPSQWLHRECFV